MKRLIIPFTLIPCIVFLVTIQCATIVNRPVWDVQLELLPALLLYAAFTVPLPLALLLSVFAGITYDSLSAGMMGTSVMPYALATSLFCAVRPIFFRNQISTQFMSGFIYAFIALSLQGVFSGKFLFASSVILQKVLRLSLFSGGLAVIFFTAFDKIFRRLHLSPGRFEDPIQ